MVTDHYSLIDLFNLYRREIGYGVVASIVATMRHIQLGDSWRYICTNAVICGVIALGMDTILGVFGINSGKVGFLSAAMLGYVGVEVLLAKLSDKFPLFMSEAQKQHASQKRIDNETK